MSTDRSPVVRSVADITRRSANTPQHRLPNLMPSDTDVVESQNGVMRKCWEKVVCKELGMPDTYQKVAVLIIRWDDSLDADLKSKDEVDELNRIFHDGFNFESQVVVLNNNKRPQVLVDRAISNFVADHDGHHRSHLLIVYYTGHGFLKAPDYDSLIISGKSKVTETYETLYPPEAKWDQAETTLNDAEADVLTIMDCCFAGSVMKGQTENSKLYELLAACGKNDKTEKPGHRSYTRALIDSLKAVLDREDKRILTFDLNQMILSRRSWNTKPHVHNRLQTSTTRHICLAPLSRLPVSPTDILPRNAGHLNLRLAFRHHHCLSSQHVEQLARSLSQAAKDSELDISAIDWMGFEPHRASNQFRSRVRLVMAMNRWLRKKQESTKRKRSSENAEEEPMAKRQQQSSEDSGTSRPVDSPVDVQMPTPDASSRGTTPR